MAGHTTQEIRRGIPGGKQFSRFADGQAVFAEVNSAGSERKSDIQAVIHNDARVCAARSNACGADRLGAEHTPEAYYLDANNRLLYHGRIDNSKDPAQVESNDLRDALDAALAGEPIQKTRSLAFGCSIKRV